MSTPSRDLPAVLAPQAVAPLRPVQAVQAVQRASRLQQVVPSRPTRRERRVGREVAYRGTVADAQRELHYHGALAAARVVDHAQEVSTALTCAINARVRAVEHPDDRAEVAAQAVEWKAMGLRHQRAMAEAGAYRIMELVDKPIYTERHGGLGALADRILGD